MGTIADTLFSALMSWVRALVNDLWKIFTSESTTILEFLGKNWIGIVVVLLAAGLVIDWLIWLVRWQPYHLWAQRVRRLLRIPSDDVEEEEPRRKATAAQLPKKRQDAVYRPPQQEENWLPERPSIGEEDARQAYRQADSVPDAALGAYPGMRYGADVPAQTAPATADPASLSAVHSEGPGAAEVARRRAEIDAWQLQLQEEARARAEAEQARLLRQAQEAERIRRAREAEEAQRARQAMLRAQQEEQARQAQAQYERELAEYERQRAQYERELAEYERQKAEYDAQMAAWQAQQAQQAASAQQAAAARRQAPRPVIAKSEPQAQPEPPAQPKKGLKGRMLRAMQQLEPEETEVNAITAIPSRVNMKDAYAPAKRPKKPGARRK